MYFSNKKNSIFIFQKKANLNVKDILSQLGSGDWEYFYWHLLGTALAKHKEIF